jgi:hypothetical protein
LDHNEQFIVAEVLEDIDFPVIDLSGIDLVELLHEHEGVEEQSSMLQKFWMVTHHIGHVDCAHHDWDVEDQVALEHDEEQDSNLVDGH